MTTNELRQGIIKLIQQYEEESLETVESIVMQYEQNTDERYLPIRMKEIKITLK